MLVQVFSRVLKEFSRVLEVFSRVLGVFSRVLDVFSRGVFEGFRGSRIDVDGVRAVPRRGL